MTSCKNQCLKAAPRLVDKATRECGQAGSGESAWVALKDFARCSDAHLLAIAGAVWEHLGAPHSQARWQALELCARLWPRSAAFRHALMRDIPTFVQLVCAIAPAASAGRAAAARGGLPPPEHWAKQLHRRGVELIERWHASHGHLPEYRQLDLARRRVCTSAASASASLDDGPQAQRWAEQWQQLRDGGAEASLAEAAAAVEQLGTCVQIMAPVMDEADGADEAAAAASGARGGARGEAAAAAAGQAAAAAGEAAAAARRPRQGGATGEEIAGGAAAAGLEAAAEEMEEEGEEEREETEEETEEEEEEEEEEEAANLAGAPRMHALGAGAVQIDLRQPEQRSEEERAALGEALQGACREVCAAHFRETLPGHFLAACRVLRPTEGLLPPSSQASAQPLPWRASSARASLRHQARLRLLPKLRAHLAALAHAPLDDDLQSHERRVTRGCEPRLAGLAETAGWSVV